MAVRREDPDYPDIAPSPLVEDVLGILEDAGVDEAINDAVVKRIEQFEIQARAEVERVREAAFDDAEKSVREAVAAFCRSDAFVMSGPAGVGMAAVRAIRDAKSRSLLHPTGGRDG